MDGSLEREGEGSSSKATQPELAESAAETPAMEDAKRRQRARQTLVCAECKRLKLKCDRRTPCDQCVKRETTQKCVYQANAADRVDVYSLNNKFKDFDRKYHADHQQILEEFEKFKKEVMRQLQSIPVPGPTATVSEPMLKSCSREIENRHRFIFRPRIAPRVGNVNATNGDALSPRNASLVPRARAVLVSDQLVNRPSGILFANSHVFELGVESTYFQESDDGSGPDVMSPMDFFLIDDSIPTVPSAFVPIPASGLATLFVSGSLGIQVTPQAISCLPSSATCDFLLSKLTTALAVGFGAFMCGAWFVGRVKDILSNLCRLTAVSEKGKGKAADVPDADANADSDSSEGSGNNARNVTLAQFALVAATLAVCARSFVEGKRMSSCSSGDASSVHSPQTAPSSGMTSNESDVSFDDSLPETLYGLAETALALQNGVTRYNLDSVITVILQSLYLSFSAKIDVDKLDNLVREAIALSMKLGLHVDPSEIVLGKPRPSRSLLLRGGGDGDGDGSSVERLRRRASGGDDVVVKEEQTEESVTGSNEEGKEMGGVERKNRRGLTKVESEVRRRVWWSVVLLDQFRLEVSSTSSTPMLFPDSFTTHLPNATTSIPANSTSCTSSSSYVAIGESITNSNLFSVNVTPPSEPTLIGGEEEKMAVEYFVVRCRFAQVLMDARRSAREVVSGSDTSSVCDFIVDVAKEAARLFKELPEKMRMRVMSINGNTRCIDTSTGGVEVARKCTVLVAQHGVLLSTYCRLMNHVKVQAEPDGAMVAMTKVSTASRETLHAARTLLTLFNDGASRNVVFSAHALAKIFYDTGFIATNVAMVMSGTDDASMFVKPALDDAHAALEALKDPVVSGLEKGDMTDAARMLEGVLLKTRARLDESRSVSTTMVKVKAGVSAKRRRDESEKRTESVHGHCHGEPGGDAAPEAPDSDVRIGITALPFKRPRIMVRPRPRSVEVEKSRTPSDVVVVEEDAPTTTTETVVSPVVQLTSVASESANVPVLDGITQGVIVAETNVVATDKAGTCADWVEEENMAFRFGSRRAPQLPPPSTGGFCIRRRDPGKKSSSKKDKQSRSKAKAGPSSSTNVNADATAAASSHVIPRPQQVHTPTPPVDVGSHSGHVNVNVVVPPPTTPHPTTPTHVSHHSMTPEAPRGSLTPQGGRRMTPIATTAAHFSSGPPPMTPMTVHQPQPHSHSMEVPFHTTPSPHGFQSAVSVPNHGMSQYGNVALTQPHAMFTSPPPPTTGSQVGYNIPSSPSHIGQGQGVDAMFPQFYTTHNPGPTGGVPLTAANMFPNQGGGAVLGAHDSMRLQESAMTVDEPVMGSLPPPPSEHPMQFTAPSPGSGMQFGYVHTQAQPQQQPQQQQQQRPIQHGMIPTHHGPMTQTYGYDTTHGVDANSAAGLNNPNPSQTWTGGNHQGAGYGWSQ